jgi:hypothetical protein
MESHTEETILELIQRYNNDILYDAHSVEARIRRSEAKRNLVLIGKDTLKLISEKLKDSFPENEEIDYDLFMAWNRLICEIIDTHSLPEAPYAKDVPYGQQSVEKWVAYCTANG